MQQAPLVRLTHSRVREDCYRHVEERLERWRDGRLTGGGKVTAVDRAEEPGAKDQEADQPESSQPRTVAVSHQTIEDVSPQPPHQVTFGETAALLRDEDASGVLVMAGAAIDGGELVVDLCRVTLLIAA